MRRGEKDQLELSPPPLRENSQSVTTQSLLTSSLASSISHDRMMTSCSAITSKRGSPSVGLSSKS